MATTARRLTYDDLEAIPQERPGDRHELIDGELVVTPAPVPVHQIVSANIQYALAHHVRVGKLGLVLDAPVDVCLTPDNVLIPDIIFIAQERLHIIGPKAVDAAPDLVVEILSPGTHRRDLGEKRELYARFGVQEYWLVDPEAKAIVILALTGAHFAPRAIGDDGVISSRILPALTLTVAEIVAGVQ